MAFQWLDAYGRKVNTTVLKQEQAAPTSSMVRRSDAMHPASGLTPQRLAMMLRDSIDGDPERYLALAEDMEERDLHYAGVLGVRKRQVSGLEITVEAAGDDEASQAAAEIIRDVVNRDGFEDELFDILDAIGKGFSCTEIIWDTSEGQWRPKRLAWRDPRWFTFDRTDRETPLLRSETGDVPLNPYQWIHHCAKTKSGLPIRGGIARSAAWGFLFKSFSMKDWAIFCEAYGQPLRLGKYGLGATETDKEKLLEAVTSIGSDYAAIVPADMAVEFIKADVTGSLDLYERRIAFLDQQVSKLVLGQTATTDAIAGGHAVGKTHDGVREDIEQADARQLAATLNRDLVRPVVDFERGPQKKYPKIRLGRPDEQDIEKLVANVVKLVPLGLKVSESAMRDKIGIPDPADGEELLRGPSPPAAVPGANGINNAKPEPDNRDAVQNTAGAQAARDSIDRAVAEALADWEAMTTPMAGSIAHILENAGSPEEIERALAEHFSGLDASALTRKLAEACFAARMAGEADITP